MNPDEEFKRSSDNKSLSVIKVNFKVKSDCTFDIDLLLDGEPTRLYLTTKKEKTAPMPNCKKVHLDGEKFRGQWQTLGIDLEKILKTSGSLKIKEFKIWMPDGKLKDI